MSDGNGRATIGSFDEIAVEERPQTAQGLATKVALHHSDTALGEEPVDPAMTVVDGFTVIKKPELNKWGNTALLRANPSVLGVHFRLLSDVV